MHARGGVDPIDYYLCYKSARFQSIITWLHVQVRKLGQLARSGLRRHHGAAPAPCRGSRGADKGEGMGDGGGCQRQQQVGEEERCGACCRLWLPSCCCCGRGVDVHVFMGSYAPFVGMHAAHAPDLPMVVCVPGVPAPVSETRRGHRPPCSIEWDESIQVR